MIQNKKLVSAPKCCNIRNCQEFVIIPGFSDYCVDADGCLFKICTNGFYPMKPSLDDGYNKFTLIDNNDKRRKVPAHTAVLRAWRGKRPSNKEARHLDGNRLNNYVENLIWGTRQQNSDDKFRHGTNTWGEKHSSSKLNSLQVRIIRRATNVNPVFLSEIFSISIDTVKDIKDEDTWRLLDQKPEAKALSLLWENYNDINFVQFRIALRCQAVPALFLSELLKVKRHLINNIRSGCKTGERAGWDKLTLGQVIKMRWSQNEQISKYSVNQ